MKRWGTILAAVSVFAAGCNRQDADTLARIGDKLVTRAKAVSPVQGGKDKLTVAIPSFADGRPEADSSGK